MATEDSSGTAAQTSLRTTNARTHKAFIVALLLRAILAGFLDSPWVEDRAHRDIQELIEHGVPVQNPGGGRSTSYSLAQSQ
jgi:hypothetical protein